MASRALAVIAVALVWAAQALLPGRVFRVAQRTGQVGIGAPLWAKKKDAAAGNAPKTPGAKRGPTGKAAGAAADDDDLDMGALPELDDFFPQGKLGGIGALDGENDAELDEALRGIESGEFDLDDLFDDVFGKKAGSGGGAAGAAAESALNFGDADLDAAPKAKGKRGRKPKSAGLAKDDALGDLDPELLEAFAEFAAIEEAEAGGLGRGVGGGAGGGGVGGDDGALPPLNLGDIAGLDLDAEEFALSEGEAAAAPPLEEFKRLMESLGPDNLFGDDDLLFGLLDEPDIDEDLILAGKSVRNFEHKENVVVELRATPDGDQEFHDGVLFNGDELPPGELTPRVDTDELDPYYDVYAPNIYDGGRARSAFERFKVDPAAVTEARKFNHYLYASEPDERIKTRVRVISVVTNSSRNATALEIVNKVYDYMRVGLEADVDKVDFEIHCYKYDDESEGVEPLDDMIQMWLESYNTYHLVDGAAMKEAWGHIMPHIMLSDKNLRALLDQVKWALHEDQMGGALLSPRMRRIRFRGGAQEMVTGYNTEELDAEFSVVSVR